jgi:diguanylate cyclase (GGDEF)-like protein/PAS domain S-box-containing protein
VLGIRNSGSAFAARRLLRPAILFATTGAVMALLFGLLVPRGHLMYVWPVTGMQLALLLSSREDKRWFRLEICAAAAAFFVTGLVLHIDLLFLAILQGVELSLLLLLLRGHVECFDDLKTRTNIMRFFLAAILVPALTAIAAPLAKLAPISALRLWSAVALADSLGIAVYTPALLFLLSGRLWRKDQTFYEFRKGMAASALFLGVTAAVFSQNVNPFLYMIFPPLILVVFVLGVRGAIFASVATTLIASWATAHGHGPLWIARGVTMDHRVLILQILLWSVVATALPVGCLLDERNVQEQQASKNQRIYETLIRNSEDMIILSGLDGISRFVSPAVEQVTGWTAAEYMALPKLGSVHDEDRDLAQAVVKSLSQGKTTHTFRYRLLHKDGGFGWVESYVRGYSDSEGGPITGYVATVHDISAQKQTEDSWSAEKHELSSQNERLAKLASRDELTGLANRRIFNQVLEREAVRQGRSHDSLSLLMIDVDSFKKFNDRYGHQAGDVCLQKVARVFKECAHRTNDLAARVGGEEFAVLLPQTDEAGALLVADAILEGIRQLRLVHEDSVTGSVSVSVGISTWQPDQSIASTQLIQQADRALYESKRTGRNRLTVWNGTRELAAQTLPA